MKLSCNLMASTSAADPFVIFGELVCSWAVFIVVVVGMCLVPFT